MMSSLLENTKIVAGMLVYKEIIVSMVILVKGKEHPQHFCYMLNLMKFHCYVKYISVGVQMILCIYTVEEMLHMLTIPRW